MTFESIVRRYLRRLETEYTTQVVRGGASGELPLRPTVHQFIVELVSSISSAVDVAHEPRRVGRNKPDWRFDDQETLGIYCYGDHKGIDTQNKFDPRGDEKQFARYLKLGRPLFVTDGIDFVFLSPNSKPKECSLVAKPLPQNGWDNLTIEMGVEEAFREIVEAPGFRPLSDERLVGELARRAHLLSETLLDLLEAGVGGGQTQAEEALIANLINLQAIVSDHHDPSLRKPQHCADFMSQVLVFGLFYAHRRAQHENTTPEERRQMILDFWDSGSGSEEAKRLRPFKALVELLHDDLDPGTEVGAWYLECARILAHAECMSGAIEEPAYDTLFEEFLEAYDNSLRFDRGAFYTPRCLINYIVRSADALTLEHFNGSMYVVADRIIDPCCGTGGFLDELVINARDGDNVCTMVGFEVLPAPYALSQYRLARSVRGTAYEDHVKIILTDTLSDALNIADDKKADSALLEEIIEARELADLPLMVIVGNPPSSDVVASTAPRTYVEKLLDVFRPPAEYRGSRQNVQKATNNEFMRFLAWSADRVLRTGRGVIALVLPASFANGVSFKYARKWMTEKFTEIRVLSFDQDCRSGVASQSLFSILQGRLVLFAALVDGRSGTDSYFFKNISPDTKREKLAYLAENDCYDGFEEYELDQETYQFLPIGEYDNSLYQDCWPIISPHIGAPSIFVRKCSGVKTGLTRALFHVNETVLRRRNSDIGNLRRQLNELIERWFRGQQRLPSRNKFTEDVRRALRNVEPQAYTFRPFVEGYLAYNESVVEALRGLGGDGARPRPEVQAAFDQGAVSIVVAPGPADLGDTLTRIVSFAWSLPDNDIPTRGNGMVYCDVFPEPINSTWDSTALPNVTPEIQGLFDFSDNPLQAVVFYCYGVMSSDAYLKRFEPILFRSADPSAPPRIPILQSADQRLQIVEMGREIALLERSGANLPDDYTRLELEYFEEGDEDFNLHAVENDPLSGRLRLSDKRKSSFKELRGIPEEVLGLTISGNSVVGAWLKERMWKYYRRDFRREDFTELINLLERINAQCLLIDRVSGIVEQALNERAIISCSE